MQTNLLFYVALLSAARHRRRSNWVRMWNVDGIYVCFVVVVRWVEFACRSPWRSTSSGGCCHLAHETIGLLCMCWVFGQMRDELHARQLFTFFSVIRYLGWKKFPKLFPLPTAHYPHTYTSASGDGISPLEKCLFHYCYIFLKWPSKLYETVSEWTVSPYLVHSWIRRIWRWAFVARQHTQKALSCNSDDTPITPTLEIYACGIYFH